MPLEYDQVEYAGVLVLQVMTRTMPVPIDLGRGFSSSRRPFKLPPEDCYDLASFKKENWTYFSDTSINSACKRDSIDHGFARIQTLRRTYDEVKFESHFSSSAPNFDTEFMCMCKQNDDTATREKSLEKMKKDALEITKTTSELAKYRSIENICSIVTPDDDYESQEEDVFEPDNKLQVSHPDKLSTNINVMGCMTSNGDNERDGIKEKQEDGLFYPLNSRNEREDCDTKEKQEDELFYPLNCENERENCEIKVKQTRCHFDPLNLNRNDCDTKKKYEKEPFVRLLDCDSESDCDIKEKQTEISYETFRDGVWDSLEKYNDREGESLNSDLVVSDLEDISESPDESIEEQHQQDTMVRADSPLGKQQLIFDLLMLKAHATYALPSEISWQPKKITPILKNDKNHLTVTNGQTRKAHRVRSKSSEYETRSRPVLLRRKSVHFADSRGLDLEIRHPFLVADDCFVPPKLMEELRKNRAAANKNCENNKNKIVHPPNPVPTSSFSIRPTFVQPANYMNFTDRIRTKKVCLENLSMSHDSLSGNGTIIVENMEYNKNVFIRMSFNKWRSYLDVRTTFVPGCSIADDFDRFGFTFYIPRNFKGADNIEFAVCYRLPSTGREYWDNNENHNYVLKSTEYQHTDNHDNFTIA